MNKSDWKYLKNIEDLNADDMSVILGAPSYSDAADCTGLSQRTCRALRRLAAEFTAGAPSDLEAIQSERDEACEQLARALADNKELRTALAMGEECRQAAVVRLPKPALQKGEQIADSHSLLSDLHLGLLVRPDTVLGLNAYDITVAKQRLALYFDRTIKLLTMHSKHRRVKKHWIWLQGDFIHNELHGGDGETSCVEGPMVAAVLCTSLISAGLVKLRVACKKLGIELIVLIVGGNHDRTTRLMEHARSYAVSYAYPIAAGLREHLPGLEIRAPHASQVLVETDSGHIIRGMHGHQFKYNRGIGGPEVPIRRAIGVMNQTIKSDLLVLGHFHEARTPGDMLINGSVCGTSPYSHEGMFGHRPAEQLFFMTDSHYGLSAIHRILLQD